MGKPRMANCPWVCCMDERITRTTQRGLYIGILFKMDMSGFYLTLTQGITFFKERYGGKYCYRAVFPSEDAILSNNGCVNRQAP